MVFLGREITEQRDYGDKVADAIDQEVNDLIQESYETAKRVLTENRARLDYVSGILVHKEGLEGDEMERAFTEPMDGRKSAKKARSKKNRQPVMSVSEPETNKRPAAPKTPVRKPRLRQSPQPE
jgi:cell division protease FtsH